MRRPSSISPSLLLILPLFACGGSSEPATPAPTAGSGVVVTPGTGGTVAAAGSGARAGTTGTLPGSVSTGGTPASAGIAGASGAAGATIVAAGSGGATGAGPIAGATASAGTSGASTAGTGGATAGAAGGGAASAATFSAVFEIFADSGCAVTLCHNAAGTSMLVLVDQAAAYTALVGAKAAGSDCASSGLSRVKASDPDASLLVQKLEGTQECGAAMPPGGMLTKAQMELVRNWVKAGAKND